MADFIAPQRLIRAVLSHIDPVLLVVASGPIQRTFKRAPAPLSMSHPHSSGGRGAPSITALEVCTSTSYQCDPSTLTRSLPDEPNDLLSPFRFGVPTLILLQTHTWYRLTACYPSVYSVYRFVFSCSYHLFTYNQGLKLTFDQLVFVVNYYMSLLTLNFHFLFIYLFKAVLTPNF